MGSNYPHVFSPIEIRGLLFKNRIELAPPGCLGTADERGFATDRFVNTFRQFARAGVAIVSVGNCTIDITESSDEGGQLELKDTAAAMPLNKFAKMCESFGAYGSLELTHNGKDTPFETVGHAAYSCSSFVTVAEKLRAERLHRDPIPTIEMSREKIKETVEKYANAAWICKKAGLKMLMIHGAHGNLIAQFASPYFNKRTDEYGGSLENRARFAIEILDAIRARVGERFVIEYRLSAEEFHPEQMHFDETLKFIGLIKDKVDILHVSAGIHDVWGEPHYMRYLFQPYMLDQMYNVHFAADVKKAYPDLIVNTVGSIKDIRQAEEIIASGKADFVSMHRALNADFDMLHKFASGRDEEHVPCLRCACVRMGDPPSFPCAVNPMYGMAEEYPEGCVTPAKEKKKVAVIGGGPAGIQAVKTLLERGHDVTIYEKNAQFGGNVQRGVSAPFKQDLRDYLRYLKGVLNHAPVRKFLNTEATPEMLYPEHYDAVVVALGADPILPKVSGVDKPHVHWAPFVENGCASAGDKVVIVGGSSVGTETAIHLAMQGKKVTVIDMNPQANLGTTGAEYDLLQMCEKYQVVRNLGWKLLEITDNAVIAEDVRTGEKRAFEADTVLMAVGMKPRKAEAMKFYHCCPETNFRMIGDCTASGDVRDAVHAAFDACRYL
jgi:2,4-dienoyl-CoA reductase-like NADH-dependent reductase (Old Yellow Enzyme family)/thioredoxin reductase